MLNSSKKSRQKKNILTLMLSEKKILNETKNHTPPCKLNGRSLNSFRFIVYFLIFKSRGHDVHYGNSIWEQQII